MNRDVNLFGSAQKPENVLFISERKKRKLYVKFATGYETIVEKVLQEIT